MILASGLLVASLLPVRCLLRKEKSSSLRFLVNQFQYVSSALNVIQLLLNLLMDHLSSPSLDAKTFHIPPQKLKVFVLYQLVLPVRVIKPKIFIIPVHS